MLCKSSIDQSTLNIHTFTMALWVRIFLKRLQKQLQIQNQMLQKLCVHSTDVTTKLHIKTRRGQSQKYKFKNEKKNV